MIGPIRGLVRIAEPPPASAAIGRRIGGRKASAASGMQLGAPRQKLGLLPGREAATFVDLVVIEEVGICPLRPAARRLVLLAREHGHCDRSGDTLGIEEPAPVLPVKTRRGDPFLGHPVKRDVVEDLVAGELSPCARGTVQSRETTAAAGWSSASFSFLAGHRRLQRGWVSIQAAAAAREETPSLVRALATCRWTVCALRTKRSAI